MIELGVMGEWGGGDQPKLKFPLLHTTLMEVDEKVLRAI